ncbi:MAG: lamin tail domain-containing protein, partial [Bacteroidota bacterium]
YQPSWGGNTGGKSIERVLTQLSSTESSNWKSSTSIFKATPGRINSVTAKNKDLSVKQFVLVGVFAEVGRQIQLKAEIENLGSDNVINFAVKFYKDINNNSIGEQNELVSEELLQNINAGQIKEFIFNTTNFTSGNNRFLVFAEYGEDQFPENNSAALNITGYVINELRGDLVINEIMYAPNSPEPERIEIYNRSSRIINMLGYKIADDATTTRVINSSLVINPGNYLVIAKDSSIVTLHNNIPLLRISTFASLNNSGDRVMLLDSLNRVIDSLDYKSSWGGSSGKSLERIDANRSSIDSTNWKTSSAILGSTPGYFNSVSPYDNNLALSILSHSPLLPIKGDSVTINIKIENIGRNTANNFSLEIYDDVNRDSAAQSAERISIKNFTSLASSAVITTQIKVYAAEVRAYRIIARLNFSADEVLSNNTAFREYSVSEIPASINEIVINEIMYAPSSDEPEW